MENIPNEVTRVARRNHSLLAPGRGTVRVSRCSSGNGAFNLALSLLHFLIGYKSFVLQTRRFEDDCVLDIATRKARLNVQRISREDAACNIVISEKVPRWRKVLCSERAGAKTSMEYLTLAGSRLRTPICMSFHLDLAEGAYVCSRLPFRETLATHGIWPFRVSRYRISCFWWSLHFLSLKNSNVLMDIVCEAEKKIVERGISGFRRSWEDASLDFDGLPSPISEENHNKSRHRTGCCSGKKTSRNLFHGRSSLWKALGRRRETKSHNLVNGCTEKIVAKWFLSNKFGKSFLTKPIANEQRGWIFTWKVFLKEGHCASFMRKAWNLQAVSKIFNTLRQKKQPIPNNKKLR